MSTANKRTGEPYSEAIKGGKRAKHDLKEAGRGIDGTIQDAAERINGIMGGKTPPKKRKKK